MSDLPDSLAEDERVVRAYAADSGDVILRRHLAAVLAEYDRLRAVETAAAALVDAINVSQLDLSNSVRDAYYDLHVLLNGEPT